MRVNLIALSLFSFKFSTKYNFFYYSPGSNSLHGRALVFWKKQLHKQRREITVEIWTVPIPGSLRSQPTVAQCDAPPAPALLFKPQRGHWEVPFWRRGQRSYIQDLNCVFVLEYFWQPRVHKTNGIKISKQLLCSFHPKYKVPSFLCHLSRVATLRRHPSVKAKYTQKLQLLHGILLKICLFLYSFAPQTRLYIIFAVKIFWSRGTFLQNLHLTLLEYSSASGCLFHLGVKTFNITIFLFFSWDNI